MKPLQGQTQDIMKLFVINKKVPYEDISEKKVSVRKAITKTLPPTTANLTTINPLHLSMRVISTVKEE